MTDGLQWLISLMFEDMARLVAGIFILITLIEVLSRFKEWLQ